MPEHEISAAVYWFVGILQTLGLTTAWLARVSEGSDYQVHCQRLFLAALLVIGGFTIVAASLGPCLWLASGATLAMMVLATTCDFTGHRRATAW